MSDYKLILASASPRRQELLNQIAVQFSVQAQDIDESLKQDESAEDYVCRMAKEKAQSALDAHVDSEHQIILAADTVVVCDDEIMGKPADKQQSAMMLGKLSGRQHRVLSAICLASGERFESALSESWVSFRNISEQEARAYWQSGEPAGKAGSYAIQGLAAIFVTRLEGSYSGVMGLPLYETAALLDSFGIDCINTPSNLFDNKSGPNS
jgi:septum formation protein